MKKCKHKKSNGKKCNAYAMSGSEYCYSHNPKISKKEKKESQSRGGKNNATILNESLDPIEIKSSKDVPDLIIDTINKVRSGELEIRIANCIGYLSGHLLKAFEQSDLEKRIEDLETKIEKINEHK